MQAPAPERRPSDPESASRCHDRGRRGETLFLPHESPLANLFVLRGVAFAAWTLAAFAIGALADSGGVIRGCVSSDEVQATHVVFVHDTTGNREGTMELDWNQRSSLAGDAGPAGPAAPSTAEPAGLGARPPAMWRPAR